MRRHPHQGKLSPIQLPPLKQQKKQQQNSQLVKSWLPSHFPLLFCETPLFSPIIYKKTIINLAPVHPPQKENIWSVFVYFSIIFFRLFIQYNTVKSHFITAKKNWKIYWTKSNPVRTVISSDVFTITLAIYITVLRIKIHWFGFYMMFNMGVFFYWKVQKVWAPIQSRIQRIKHWEKPCSRRWMAQMDWIWIIVCVYYHITPIQVVFLSQYSKRLINYLGKRQRKIWTSIAQRLTMIWMVRAHQLKRSQRWVQYSLCNIDFNTVTLIK